MLIIDPDDIERRYIAAILAADGFDVFQVPSTIEGLVQAMKAGPDLVVISEETHPVRVHEAVSVLRRLTSAPLMIVGTGESGGEMASLREGGDFYLTRPFGAPELASRVRMLIRRAGARPETAGERPEDRANDGSEAWSHHAGPRPPRVVKWRRGFAGEAA